MVKCGADELVPVNYRGLVYQLYADFLGFMNFQGLLLRIGSLQLNQHFKVYKDNFVVIVTALIEAIAGLHFFHLLNISADPAERYIVKN